MKVDQLFIFIQKFASDMKRILPFILLILSSCSIQKRHFTKGYDIQWKGTYAYNSSDLLEFETVISEPCDTIKNKDGSIILAAVERIDSKKIYVTPCENSGLTKNEFEKSNVVSIHYANGALFENKTPEQQQKEREENLRKYRENQEAREAELIKLQQDRLTKENEALKKQIDSLQKNPSKPQENYSIQDNSEVLDENAPEPIVEPVMKAFFTIAYIIAGLSFALIALEIIVLPLLALLFVDVLSPFFTLYSWLKIKRFPEKFKGKPVLRELLLFFLSLGAVGLVILLFL
jgi:hypothetical protein